FGGPEGMDDVIPFLENVLRGRNVPQERLLQVARHYEMFGGVSPLNEQNRKLIAALTLELARHGPQLPIYWGNRNWHPLLPDAIQQMTADGRQHALAFVTSAYSSYSSCRQYLENIAVARETVGPKATRVDKLRVFYNHPLFVAANVERVREKLLQFPGKVHDSLQLVFTAHSIPESMAANCDYLTQLRETGRLVAEELGTSNWQLVFQSRSGSPQQPWLGPDICDHLREAKLAGLQNVLVAPIGFVSDHMEVIYDLDVQAQQLAVELGLNLKRAATAGTHPLFVQMIRELIRERTSHEPPRYLGSHGARHDVCLPDCCPSGMPIRTPVTKP
ncbi:MAG TPA: ferrochelatase, partial [Pyrinomonadaceae bacterium]|nr:ferrochelatase [Pyrinomonadaceae bacterium]